jgi:hypothetical protein
VGRFKSRQLLAIDGKLKVFLAGKGAPADAVTQMQMAYVAERPVNRLYLTAARLYRDAFARQPKLAESVPSSVRYNAACSAALAGCGQGKDVDKLDDKQRAHWRQQALDWLRADLAWWTKTLNKTKAQNRASIAQQMQHWQTDPDLAAVRDADALSKLPEDERAAWRHLWSDVDALQRRAASAK